MDPADGEAEIHEPRFDDQDPDGARPGVGTPADIGVAGASGL